MPEYEWDVFISHASEDKDTVVKALVHGLEGVGLRVWFDEQTLTLGDSLRRKIEHGLARSQYGIVVLSPSFFAKEWPQRELDGLAAMEMPGRKVILPVWHDVGFEEVRKFSPTLAERLAASTGDGFEALVKRISDVVLGRRTGTNKVRHGVFVLTGCPSVGKDALLYAAYRAHLREHPAFHFPTKCITREPYTSEEVRGNSAERTTPYFVAPVKDHAQLDDSTKYFNVFGRYEGRIGFDRAELESVLGADHPSRVVYVNAGIERLTDHRRELRDICFKIQRDGLRRHPGYCEWRVDQVFVLIDAPVEQCLRRLAGRNLPVAHRRGRELATEKDYRIVAALKERGFFEAIVDNSDQRSCEEAALELSDILTR